MDLLLWLPSTPPYFLWARYRSSFLVTLVWLPMTGLLPNIVPHYPGKSWGPKCRHPAGASRVLPGAYSSPSAGFRGRAGAASHPVSCQAEITLQKEGSQCAETSRQGEMRESKSCECWCFYFQSPRSCKILILLFFFQSCASCCEPQVPLALVGFLFLGK